VTLEILLESWSFGGIPEGDGHFNPPRQVVCGRPYYSQIVLLQAALKITGEAGVMAVRVINANELVNVVEHGVYLPGRSPV
jgi:hypothetical protein